MATRYARPTTAGSGSGLLVGASTQSSLSTASHAPQPPMASAYSQRPGKAATHSHHHHHHHVAANGSAGGGSKPAVKRRPAPVPRPPHRRVPVAPQPAANGRNGGDGGSAGYVQAAASKTKAATESSAQRERAIRAATERRRRWERTGGKVGWHEWQYKCQLTNKCVVLCCGHSDKQRGGLESRQQKQQGRDKRLLRREERERQLMSRTN